MSGGGGGVNDDRDEHRVDVENTRAAHHARVLSASHARPSLNLATTASATSDKWTAFSSPTQSPSPEEYFKPHNHGGPSTPDSTPTTPSGVSLRRSGALGRHSRSSSRSSTAAANSAANSPVALRRQSSITAFARSASGSASASANASGNNSPTALVPPRICTVSSGNPVGRMAAATTTAAAGIAAPESHLASGAHLASTSTSATTSTPPPPPPLPPSIAHAGRRSSSSSSPTSSSLTAPPAPPPPAPDTLLQMPHVPRRRSSVHRLRRDTDGGGGGGGSGGGGGLRSPARSSPSSASPSLAPSPLPSPGVGEGSRREIIPRDGDRDATTSRTVADSSTTARLAPLPPSSPPSASPPPPPPPRIPRSTTADSSSDMSDYGSQADEDEVEYGGGGGGENDVATSGRVDEDLGEAIKLTGGPPKLQRRQRGKPSSASASAASGSPVVDDGTATAAAAAGLSSPQSFPSSSRGVDADATPIAPGRNLPSDTAVGGGLSAPSSPTRSNLARLQPDTARTQELENGIRMTAGESNATRASASNTARAGGSKATTPRANSSPDSAEDAAATSALEAEAQRLADLENPNRPRTLKEARELAKNRAAQKRRGGGGGGGGGGAGDAGAGNGATTSSTAFARPTLPPSHSTASVMDELQAAVGDALEEMGSDGQEQQRGAAATSTSTTHQHPHAHAHARPHSQATTDRTGGSRQTSFDSARSYEESEPEGYGYKGAAGGDETPGGNASANAAVHRNNASTAALPASTSAQTIRGGDAMTASTTSASSPYAHPNPDYRLAQPLPSASPARYNNAAPPQVKPRSSSTASSSAAVNPTQRTLISLTTRVGIPGKTIPFPPAMNAQSISIDKRKLPPWERARTYAAFINELAAVDTGLSTWMDMSQRQPRTAHNASSKGTPGTSAALPRYPSTFGVTSTDSSATFNSLSPHPRDASGASARSDMTFPMRGDGGRARDVTQVPLDQSAAPESMPDAVPANIPYPALLQQQRSDSNGGGGGGAAIPGRPAGWRPGAGGSFGNGAGGNESRSLPQPSSSSSSSAPSSALPTSIRTGLLSSLGRRGSKRNATIGPLGGGMTGMKSSGSSGSVSGPRAPRSVGRAGGGGAGGSTHNHNPYFGSGAASSSMSASPSSSGAGMVVDIAQQPSGLGLGLTRIPVEEPQQQQQQRGGAASMPTQTLRQARSNAMLNHGSGSYPRRTSSSNVNQGTDHGAQAAATSQNGSNYNNAGSTAGTSPSFLQSAVLASRKGSAASAASFVDPEALQRVMDVLPDAEEEVLARYLRRAQGDDLKAIGDYLGDQAMGNVKRR